VRQALSVYRVREKYCEKILMENEEKEEPKERNKLAKLGCTL
jgi:hypothetical protein